MINILIILLIFLACKKVLTLMIVADKEPSLVLKVKMRGKSICRYFLHDFLL